LTRTLAPHLKDPFVLLETALFDEDNRDSFLFHGFRDIIIFRHGDDVGTFFKKMEACLDRGLWLCGYCAYEFGYYLEPALFHLQKDFSFPLAWFGACPKPRVLTARQDARNIRAADLPRTRYRIQNIAPSIDTRAYREAIRMIHGYLEEGLTYQVNFSFKMKFEFEGSAFDLYRDLRRAQPTSYMGLIHTGEESILSFSPELFFRTRGSHIMTRPMKGTVARGLGTEDDARNKTWLARDDKIRAENVMIVDLLRNDLGRIAKKVWVPTLFDIEQYPTLYQMTSTIRAALRARTGMRDIFSALFPSGSVTGAPKIKTMELIAGLEKEPRGVYTGAVGYISPQRKACFNVAIRTLSLPKRGKGELGIGGGIVADSVDEKEYQEALLKARFLTETPQQFSLIETMRFEEGRGVIFVDLHLERLKKSCDYFSIPLDVPALSRRLKASQEFPRGRGIIRVLVDQQGNIILQKNVFEETPVPVTVAISPERIDPIDVFLYHKTTRRARYDEAHKKARAQGFFDAVFLNTREEVTEGAITNVFVLKKGMLYTPPREAGLLPGVLREHLLRTGKAKEKTLTLRDVAEAEKFYVGNSVRGLLEAKLYQKSKNSIVTGRYVGAQS